MMYIRCSASCWEETVHSVDLVRQNEYEIGCNCGKLSEFLKL